MRFTVRTLLFIAGLFSVLFAITVRYPPIGVACFSLVPLGFVASSRPSIRWRISLAVLAMLPIYIAASGPFNMFVVQSTFSEASASTAIALRIGHFLYLPLDYTIPTGPIGDSYDWYIGEWMEYGFQRVFGPLFDFLDEDFPDL